MQKEELCNHSINDLTLLMRKENANDSMTSTWQGPKKNTEPFFAVNKEDSEKGNNLRATKNTTTLTPKQVGGSTKGRGETCRQLRQDRGPTCKQLRHRRQRGTKPIGRRAIGILSILQALTSGDFSQSWDKFRLLGQQPTDGEVWTAHPQTHHVQSGTACHVSSREHAWLKSCKAQDCTLLRPRNNCHPRVMSRPLAVLDIDHQHSFSHPFHPLLLSFTVSPLLL